MHEIRNIAIIAHVDHGKTTLVDNILKTGNLFSEHKTPGELILDSNDLEKERGITILSKNVSVIYNDVKINIIDTPGHADFGGEVERVLNMAEGVLLLVDAFEGAMPQTRFVLKKAIGLGLKPILVINKVDKQNCRPEEVQEQVFDLMVTLDASEDQLDFPTVYGSAKYGWMSDDWKKPTLDIKILMDSIIEHIPKPKKEQGSPQMLINALEYSQYIGRIAIGKLKRGQLRDNIDVALIKRNGTINKGKIKELFLFKGLGREKVHEAESGEIIAISGLEGFDIGDTVCEPEHLDALPSIAVDEPTMSMLFTINDSPFFGKDGKYVTSRHLKERLDRELEKNLALRVHQAEKPDAFIVYGRGVLHLSILIETMRREGYELQVGQPRVIYKDIGGEKHEPIEELIIDVPDELSGRVIDIVTSRKGEMVSMERIDDRVYLEFKIPSRGIIGLRTLLLTVTYGEVVMSHRFIDYETFKGDIEKRQNGSLIAMETGTAIAYALDRLQDRGKFFIEPGDEIYKGQVVGEHSKRDDLVMNVTKTKKLTNIRAASSDEKVKLPPATKFSLEESLEYIQEDEYAEITPKSIRLRKILLDEHERKRQSSKT